MARRREYMPAGIAGLTRFTEESPEGIKLKPEHVICIVIGMIILEAFLYFGL
jgi:preprotein translocase subunit Sec61beta